MIFLIMVQMIRPMAPVRATEDKANSLVAAGVAEVALVVDRRRWALVLTAEATAGLKLAREVDHQGLPVWVVVTRTIKRGKTKSRKDEELIAEAACFLRGHRFPPRAAGG